MREVQDALAVEDGDDMLDPEGLLDAAQLTSFCADLVIINEQRQLITLVHPTTQKYFNSRKESLFPTAHEEVAATCITYLRMKPFRDEGALQDFEAFDRRCSSYSLLGYAAVNWGSHVRKAGSERATNLALALLNDESARMTASQALLLNIVGNQEFGTEWPEPWSAEHATLLKVQFEESQAALGSLHVAAYFGLVEAAEILLRGNDKVKDLASIGGTPLH